MKTRLKSKSHEGHRAKYSKKIVEKEASEWVLLNTDLMRWDVNEWVKYKKNFNSHSKVMNGSEIAEILNSEFFASFGFISFLQRWFCKRLTFQKYFLRVIITPSHIIVKNENYRLVIYNFYYVKQKKLEFPIASTFFQKFDEVTGSSPVRNEISGSNHLQVKGWQEIIEFRTNCEIHLLDKHLLVGVLIVALRLNGEIRVFFPLYSH